MKIPASVLGRILRAAERTAAGWDPAAPGHSRTNIMVYPCHPTALTVEIKMVVPNGVIWSCATVSTANTP